MATTYFGRSYFTLEYWSKYFGGAGAAVSVASGDVVAAYSSLVAGSAAGVRNAVTYGQVLVVRTSLVVEAEEGLAGGAEFHAAQVNAVARGNVLVVLVSVSPGAARASAKAVGSVVTARVTRVKPGKAEATRQAVVAGAEVSAGASLASGSASGEDNLSDEELLVLMEAA